jgi:hypothetical protein
MQLKRESLMAASLTETRPRYCVVRGIGEGGPAGSGGRVSKPASQLTAVASAGKGTH